MAHALEEYEVVTDSLVVTSQNSATLTVNAPSGKVVIGGGFQISNEPNGNLPPFWASASRPLSDNSGWRVDFRSGVGSTTSATVSVWAICARAEC